MSPARRERRRLAPRLKILLLDTGLVAFLAGVGLLTILTPAAEIAGKCLVLAGICLLAAGVLAKTDNRSSAGQTPPNHTNE